MTEPTTVEVVPMTEEEYSEEFPHIFVPFPAMVAFLKEWAGIDPTLENCHKYDVDCEDLYVASFAWEAEVRDYVCDDFAEVTEIPENLSPYIDWDKVYRDLMIGDFQIITDDDFPNDLHLFRQG